MIGLASSNKAKLGVSLCSSDTLSSTGGPSNGLLRHALSWATNLRAEWERLRTRVAKGEIGEGDSQSLREP